LKFFLWLPLDVEHALSLGIFIDQAFIATITFRCGR